MPTLCVSQFHFTENLYMVVHENPFQNVFASTMLGGRSFINEIRERHLDKKNSDRDLPDLKYFLEMPEVEQIMGQTAKVFEDDPVRGNGLNP